MHPSPGAISQALRSRFTIASAMVLAAGGIAGGALPLLEVPGLELGLAGALASTLLLAPVLGVTAFRRDARDRGAGTVARPFLATAATVALLMLVLLGASALRAVLVTPCRPMGAAPLFALVALPSGTLASAVAVGCAAVARGRRRAALGLYALVVLGSLAATLLVGYFGPAASAHDHLLGVWPGPIYDEAIVIDRRLVLFRVGTLAWSGVALAVAALMVQRRSTAPRAGPAVGLTLALLVAIAARQSGGATPTRAEIASALGAVREGPRCVVHLAAERSSSDADRALRDCEYDADAVARALGLRHAPRATVWIYRSAEEKRRLVGAGQTSFTKPWLAEIHVNDQGVPHPVLRHELVHALASVAASGPLRVPARAGFLVNAGLVEGLAVAVDVPSGDYDVHAWARAMRDQGRLPPVATLLQAGGFLGAAPARAYTAAGSLLRFLLDRYGPARVLAAYHEDDLARGVGFPVGELDAEWQRFLDGVIVPPPLAAAAEARFARGSLFARSCAREVASLEVDAGRDAARGRPAAAERALRRASALSGGDPSMLRGAAEAWRTAGDLVRAEALAREVLAGADAAGGHLALRAALLGMLGDLRLRSGDPSRAVERYRAALALGVNRDDARSLQARIAIANDASLRAAAGPWLLGVGDPTVALSRLAGSDEPLARYLLARARLSRGAPGLALPDLITASTGARLDAAFAIEARRMAADALCRVGRWDAGILAWRSVALGVPDGAARQQAEDAAARCAFERDTFGEPVRWDGDWPSSPDP